MRTLIDTSIAVALRESEAEILDRVDRSEARIVLSILSVVELEGGVPAAAEGAAVRRTLLDNIYRTFEILPFDVPEGSAYRAIIAVCGRSRRMIVDRMIAATAIANDLTLATLNPRDFRNVPGLTLEAW